PPFAWSTYRFDQQENQYTYLQTIGAAAGSNPGNAGWNGREMVAFRLHLPSKIRYHNTRGVESRGNILVWEQPLADRLRGEPISIEARMDTQSILYTTLWLFGITFVAVAVAFAVVIWWVMRRGVEPPMAAARGPGWRASRINSAQSRQCCDARDAAGSSIGRGPTCSWSADAGRGSSCRRFSSAKPLTPSDPRPGSCSNATSAAPRSSRSATWWTSIRCRHSSP